jgi:hypothetical protein
MNIKDLKQYEIESEPEQTKSKLLNLSDIGSDYTVEEDDSFLPSMQELKAGAAGAAESFTSGFAPEIAGGAQALVGALPEALGGDRYSDLLSDYKKYSAEREKDFRALEKENPDAFLTGEIAGGVGQGIVTGIATGGLGTAAALASGGSKLSMAMNAAKLAGIGAGSGALTGAGYSKESIIDAASGDSEAQEGLVKDTVTGAVLGAAGNVAAPIVGKALGKGLELGGKAVGKITDVASNVPVLEELIKTYNLTKSGKSVIGAKAKEKIGKEATSIAKELTEGFSEQGDSASTRIGNVLKSVKVEQGDIPMFLTDMEQRLAQGKTLPDDLAQITNVIDQLKTTTTKETITKGEVLAIKKLELLQEKLKNEASAMGQSIDFIPMEKSNNYLNALQKGVDAEGNPIVKHIDTLIPEDLVTKEVSENIRPDLNLEDIYKVRKSMGKVSGKLKGDVGSSQAMAAKQYADEFINERLSKEAAEELASAKQLFGDTKRAAKMIPGLENETQLGQDSYIKVREALLSPSENKAFKLDEALQLGQENFIPQTLKEDATNIALRSQLNKDSSRQALTGIAPSINAAGIIGAASLGKASNIVSKLAKTPKDFTRDLLNYSEDKLYKLAAKMPTEFAESTINALKDTTKKDRLLWALAQQPAYREAMSRAEQQEQQSEFDN